jgi:hypothetical protein
MDGLYFVLLGCAIFLLFGIVLQIASAHSLSDFRFLYNGARCILKGVDPYKPSEFLRVFLADKGDLGTGANRTNNLEMAHHMYLPTSMIIAPIAMMPWRTAAVLWTILTAAVFMTGAALMWQLAADYAPILSGFLILVLLGSSELILAIGNAAGIAIGLCCISVWCFIRNRFGLAGVFCLGISLLLKPHDAGLVWLYFLVAGGILRKRALQTLAVTFIFGTLSVLWVTHVAPNWLPELRSNLAFLSAPGHLNDPGPTSVAGRGILMVVSLQSAISMFRDDARVYNPISYIVCGMLLLMWMRTTFKSRLTSANTYLALAAVAALTMLPVYHRLGDAKLLLLAIPACAMLWAEGGTAGRCALLITAGGIALTGDLEWAVVIASVRLLHFPNTALANKLLIAGQMLPVPCILLAIGCYYLWVYVKRNAVETHVGAEKVKP